MKQYAATEWLFLQYCQKVFDQMFCGWLDVSIVKVWIKYCFATLIIKHQIIAGVPPAPTLGSDVTLNLVGVFVIV